jgi:photosynthetic reaction center cytochrome c subunit
MNADLKGWLKCSKYTALAVTFALILWMPAKITARTSTRGVAERAIGTEVQKTAAEAFKNIQVLKDIPADELMPTMRYVAAALGVGCDYCHEADHFDSDEKPTKQRARNMMKMIVAINQDNFNRKREVTCYTCHRGAAKAANIASLSAAATGVAAPASESGSNAKTAHPPGSDPGQTLAFSNAPSTSLPSVNEILAKYLEAVGGSAAIQKNHSRLEQGSMEGPRGVRATIETYRTAPDKAFAIVHRPNGDVTEGVNGEIGWGRRGTESVNGHDAYVVMAWWKGDGSDRIYFDAQNGLLLRISHRIESPLGALPLQTDYEDYRDVNGLKIPFTVLVTRVDGTTTYMWKKMDANVAIEPSRYEKPVEKPPAVEKSGKSPDAKP